MSAGKRDGPHYEYITSPEGLAQLCDDLSRSRLIAFDTEFVSEDTYRPELCLIQVAGGDQLAIVDTQEVPDLAPFWELLSSRDHEPIVHAGREEFLFIWRTLGDPPAHWCDVQIAAALTGMEYPAALGTLVGKLLGHTLPKGETRTDWRRRPLSRQQLDYAINDVLYLHEIHKQLWDRLDELDRRTWYQEEIAQWQTDVVATESQERWRRVSGISGLKSKALAIVRELWRWREEVARSRNRPPKRILRDDLIVELARRGTADVKRIRSVRGFNRGDLKKHMDDIADCIQRALDLPKEDLPGKKGRDVPKQLTVISQFLATALGSVCRRARVAPSITGSVQDMRELVAYLLKMPGWTNLQQPPKLDRGWRADVVGNKIERLLEGRLTIGISDPLSDEPLEFHDAQPEYDEKTPD